MTHEKKPRTWKDKARFFGSKVLEGVHTPHDDTIVIIATIYNHVVKRVLFNNGNANDVLYYDAMKMLGIFDEQLKPFLMSLVGFENEKVKVHGVVTLPLTLGEKPKTTNAIVDFLVVKVPSAYNVLLGCPSQNMLRAVGLHHT